jgi:uridylate kinase
MRVVVSIGGSVLAPSLSTGTDGDGSVGRIRAYAAVVEALARDHEVAAVAGGGGVAREYIGAARALGANEIELDELGIGVTRLNARLLLAALDDAVAGGRVPTDYETAGEILRGGDAVVMGGVVPAQTTDAVAAALAEYVDADLLVYATSVPGVFDADPAEDADAERYEELDAAELVEVVARGGSLGEAGSNAPIDLLAATVIRRAGIRAVVLDGTDPGAVERAVAGDHDGTIVRPEAATEGANR